MAAVGPTSVQEVESQGAGQRGVRKLDVCIFVSLALLAAALVGCGAFYLLLGHCRHHQHEQASQGSAHLIAKEVELNNGMRTWNTGPHTGGLMHGPDFTYTKNHTHPLLVNKDGVYYIYAQMALKCVYQCDMEGQVEISIHRVHDHNLETDILKMSALLPRSWGPKNSTVQSKFSATLIELSEHDVLFARMEVKENYHTITEQWQLESTKSNFMGLFPASRGGFAQPLN